MPVAQGFTNYRQISLLAIVSKLCERCVLFKHIPELPDLLSAVQHGFVDSQSCITQLLSVLNDLGTALVAGNEIDMISLDFSKAFDSLPHRHLLHKLGFVRHLGSPSLLVLGIFDFQI